MFLDFPEFFFCMMQGWLYGYRQPMIGAASRKCRFSKACPRFASAYSQRPAPAGHATRARRSHDPRPQVTRPAPAGHATRARGSLAKCRSEPGMPRSETGKHRARTRSNEESQGYKESNPIISPIINPIINPISILFNPLKFSKILWINKKRGDCPIGAVPSLDFTCIFF